MANIEDYSDQQLKDSLLEYGINVPVTPTTRKVCENKLKKMMADDGSVPIQTSISPSQGIDFTDNREGTPQFTEDSGHEVHRRNFTQHQSSRHNASDVADQSDNEGEVSVRDLSTHERQLYRARAQKNGGSAWKYVGIAFLLIVFISFLVFLNRNAQQIGDEI